MPITADDPLGIETQSDDPLGIESRQVSPPDDPLGIEVKSAPPSEFIPRNSMELGAMNAQRDADVARLKQTLPIIPSIHAGPSGFEKVMQDVRNSPAVTRLIGPQIPIPREEAPAADEIQRRGIIPTLASIPARIGNDAGRAAKAGLGDIAATMRGDQSPEGDFGGNLKQLLADKSQQLPIERGMELAAQQDRDNKDFGVSTLVADISLGLADLAPKIAMLEAAPSGMAAKAGAASAVFGFDQQGNFQPKQAAFAAAFPYVTTGASQVADKAISSAVERGVAWAGSPAAQKAIHIAANQAAMDGLMVVQDSAELMQLAQTDPQEFKRQLAKIVGSNLAFALPEVARKFERIGKPDAEPPPAKETSPDTTPKPSQTVDDPLGIESNLEPARFADGAVDPVTTALNKIRQEAEAPRAVEAPQQPQSADAPATKADLADLAAQLQEAMIGNQLKKPSESNLQTSKTGLETSIATAPAAAATPEAGVRVAPEVMKKGIAEEALTATASGATTGVAAPATSTVRSGEINPTNERQRGRVPGDPGMTAESGSNPDLGAAEISSPTQPQSEVRAPKRSKFRPTNRPYDIIDAAEEHIGGKISWKLIKEANPDWKPTGAARKLFAANGEPADTAAQALHEVGIYKGEPGQVDQFGDAMNRAAQARKGARTQKSDEASIAKDEITKNQKFHKDIKQTTKDTETLVPEDLNEGDVFKLKGAKLKVARLEYDEDGHVTGLTLDDGKQYGTQEVDGGTALRMDKGSLQKQTADAVENWLNKAIESTDLENGKVFEGVTSAPAWLSKAAANGVLRVVRAAYHATKNVAQAIQAGLEWLQDQKIKGFDEMEARTWLDKLANDERQSSGGGEKPPVETPERERRADVVKTELAAAEESLRQQTRASSNPELRKGKTAAEHRQETAVATARYRTLRDELLHHPEYAEEHISNLHAAVTEANEMLKPHGLAVHPEEFPSMARLHEVLSPEQLKRFQELQGQIENAYGEVNRMPKKLVARIQSEMEADGRLPNPKPFMPDAGRSIEQVTEWLRSKDIDSPGKSLAERLNLGSRVSDAIQGAKTSLQKTYLNAKGVWKAAVESYKAPPKDDDFRHVIKSWIYADQRSGLATHQFVKELVAKVPVTDRRKAMSIWLDANGENGLLKAQEMQVPEEYRRPWQLAQKLTPDEKALAMKIKQDFADKLDDGIKVGIIDRGREDYGVPQRWKIKPEIGTDQQMAGDRKGTPGRLEAKLDPRSPFFSFQREVPSYFDGVMAKGVPENLDIAHLVATYDAAFHKTLSSRGMIAALQEAKAKDGLPVVRISGAANVSKDGGKTYFVDSKAWTRADTSVDGRPYQSLDHSALKGWKLAQKDAEGNPIMVKGDMLIHPDHYAYLKNELGQSALREVPVIRGIMKSQAFLKASKLSASFFHLVTIGEHMASHLVNPFLNGFKIDLKQPDQQLLVRNGLELGMSYPQMAYEEGLASAHSGLFNKIPGLGDFSAKVTDWMFKDYIPAIMMKAGLHALENNRKRYGDKLTPDQVAELTAMQMNAAGGLLNYRLRGAEGNMWGRLGANKTWMDIQRMAMLAPQFLEARARVVGQALKPYGMEQRKMLILQAGMLYVGARVLNQLLDGDPHWSDNPFSVVYKGRAYSIRTIVGDFWHMITDPNSFAAGRLSPLGRVAIEDVAMNGRDLRTGARKETPIDTDSPIGRFAQNLVVDMANWLTPVTIEGLLPGSKGREQTIASAALSSIGVGSRKFTAVGQMHDLAADYNRNSKDPAARAFQKQRDGGTFAQSPYRKLDSLLDEGEFEKARREIEALKSEGRTIDQIKERYDRSGYFTGKKDREEKFIASLTARQKEIYKEAQKERAERAAAFAKALRVAVPRE